MFTPEQALQLPPELQTVYFEDVRDFYERYGRACVNFRKQGIEAKNSKAGYPARTWQQVAELLHYFTQEGLVFNFEFTPPVPISEVLYSISGHVYGLYKSARIHVYSGAHIIMPDNGKFFDDKKIGGAERYIWKNFFLHVTGIADGEKDIDDNPPEEYSKATPTQSQKPGAPSHKEVWYSAMVKKLTEGGYYVNQQEINVMVGSLMKQDGWVAPEKESDYNVLYNRLVEEASKLSQ